MPDFGFCFVSKPGILLIIILRTFGVVETSTTEQIQRKSIPVVYSNVRDDTFPLFCYRNIGVKQCLKMCETYNECDVIHFNRGTLTCELRTVFDGNIWHDQYGYMLQSRILTAVCLSLLGGIRCFHVHREWCNEVYIDDNIVAVNFSSFWHTEYVSLNKYRLHSESCWTANDSDNGPSISVYYDKKYWITSVVTQGRGDHPQWVKSFYMATLYHEKHWRYFYEQKQSYIQILLFPGNYDMNTMVESKINLPVYTNGVRINPIDFEMYRSMRFGIKGIGDIFT